MSDRSVNLGDSVASRVEPSSAPTTPPAPSWDDPDGRPAAWNAFGADR